MKSCSTTRRWRPRPVASAIALAFGAVLLGACSGTSGGGDPDGAHVGDARPSIDADRQTDATPADTGFGTITGCPDLSPELGDAEPSSFLTHIEFDRAFEDADGPALTVGGQKLLADGNAGGSSLYSEIFAYELFARCERATLLKSETEITYDPEGKITDFLVELDAMKLGVSVTRAVAFPFDAPYTTPQATTLLERKLADVLESSANVTAEDRWVKQALAVLAFGPGHATALEDAYATIDPAIRADTILWIIVTDGVDDFIYCDGGCAP